MAYPVKNWPESVVPVVPPLSVRLSAGILFR